MPTAERRRVRRWIAYWWPFDSYRDAEAGSAMERSASLRCNQELSDSLPTYINRWAIVTAVQLIVNDLASEAWAPVTGVALTVALCGLIHLIRVWLMFQRR